MCQNRDFFDGLYIMISVNINIINTVYKVWQGYEHIPWLRRFHPTFGETGLIHPPLGSPEMPSIRRSSSSKIGSTPSPPNIQQLPVCRGVMYSLHEHSVRVCLILFVTCIMLDRQYAAQVVLAGKDVFLVFVWHSECSQALKPPKTNTRNLAAVLPWNGQNGGFT